MYQGRGSNTFQYHLTAQAVKDLQMSTHCTQEQDIAETPERNEKKLIKYLEDHLGCRLPWEEPENNTSI